MPLANNPIILASRELVAQLLNNSFMFGRSIWSFRYLKHQNLSTGDDFIYSSEIILLVPLLATREVVAPLLNYAVISDGSIQWFWHLEHKNISFVSRNIRILSTFKTNKNTEHDSSSYDYIP